jgi:SOS-response transcriptional repressor LexA
MITVYIYSAKWYPLSVQGFQNPTLKHMRPAIDMVNHLVLAKSACVLGLAPNDDNASRIVRGDLLLVHQHLAPKVGDVILVEQQGDPLVVTMGNDGLATDELTCVGVVTSSVHPINSREWAQDIETASADTLNDFLIGSQPYSTVLAKASGMAMAPEIQSGDIAVVERHLDLLDQDIALFSVDGGALLCRRYHEVRRCLIAEQEDTPVISLAKHRVSEEGVISRVIRLHRQMVV